MQNHPRCRVQRCSDVSEILELVSSSEIPARYPENKHPMFFYKLKTICGVAEVIKKKYVQKSTPERFRLPLSGNTNPLIYILHPSRLQQIHPSMLRSSLRLRQTNRCTRKPPSSVHSTIPKPQQQSSSPRSSTHGQTQMARPHPCRNRI